MSRGGGPRKCSSLLSYGFSVGSDSDMTVVVQMSILRRRAEAHMAGLVAVAEPKQQVSVTSAVIYMEHFDDSQRPVNDDVSSNRVNVIHAVGDQFELRLNGHDSGEWDARDIRIFEHCDGVVSFGIDLFKRNNPLIVLFVRPILTRALACAVLVWEAVQTTKSVRQRADIFKEAEPSVSINTHEVVRVAVLFVRTYVNVFTARGGEK